MADEVSARALDSEGAPTCSEVTGVAEAAAPDIEPEMGAGPDTVCAIVDRLLDATARSSGLASEMNHECMRLLSALSASGVARRGAEAIGAFDLVARLPEMGGADVREMAAMVGCSPYVLTHMGRSTRPLTVRDLVTLTGAVGLEVHVTGAGHDFRLEADETAEEETVDARVDERPQRSYMPRAEKSAMCRDTMLAHRDLFCKFGRHMTLADAARLCSESIGSRVYSGPLKGYVADMPEFEMVRFGKIWLIRLLDV